MTRLRLAAVGILPLALSAMGAVAQAKAAAKADLKKGGGGSVLENLDRFMLAQLAAAQSPGLAAAVLYRGEVVWAKGYGLADVAKKKAMTPDSVFYSASIGKTVTATGLMQEFEAGRFKIKDDINAGGYLDFPVHHPDFPKAPITYQNLMMHRSSINDTQVVDDVAGEGDSNITMARFMKGYLLPGGEYWNKKNWSKAQPGTKHQYSNAGATLIGYLAERMAKRPFDQLCQERIFKPLGMTATTWKLAEVPKANIAMGYSGPRNKWEAAVRHGEDPAYPSGALETTVKDMARFLGAYAGHGEFKGRRILKADTVKLMLTEQIPGDPDGYGLIWYQGEWGGEMLWGHSGSYDGFNSEMWFRPSDGTGIVMFINGDKYADAQVPEAVVPRLVKDAPQIKNL